jgi:hypothetical protein
LREPTGGETVLLLDDDVLQPAISWDQRFDPDDDDDDLDDDGGT